MEAHGTGKGLPENAYRKLNPGETYQPIIKHDQSVPEMTFRSIFWGIIMAGVFSAAAAFFGLKVATVFEAAIPIAILAVGISSIAGAMGMRKSSILENVIIQSIGAASGLIVAGAIFTIPGLFILGLDVSLVKMALVSFFGGVLGILFMILFRKYFVAEMHGEFPFPEATATTEILVAGETGGKQAGILGISMLVAATYDFLILSVAAWSEVFTTRFLSFGAKIADKAKLVFKIDTLASVTGLGYIIGLKYASIICAGSFLSWFVIIPLANFFGVSMPWLFPPQSSGTPIDAMTSEQIFRSYARLVGIGGIACAGIIGIWKSRKIIIQAFVMGYKQLAGGKSSEAKEATIRTDLDIKFSTIFMILIALAIVVFFFFRYGVVADMSNPITLSLIALLVVFIIAFLFTTVAARAIAIVGTNPVSGMTLMTLIISSLILVQAGLSGNTGMLAALLIGGVVCTALSAAGGFITDLKLGYWIGATPRNQQISKFLGTIVAAICVGSVILLLNKTYGFVATPEHANPLPAPQANAMAAVLKTFMSNEPVPWALYGLGIVIALVANFFKIAPLAFALGMYIPQELNTPLLLGGFLAYLVAKSSKNQEVSKARSDRGILITSGFIAGGAIIGVVDAIIKYLGGDFERFAFLKNLTSTWGERLRGQYIAIIALVLLSCFVYFYSKAAKKEESN
jgi:putative OPT family oligopeptide transporter